ncbi:hypothetical protein BpHYR1_036498 [Brachionus plicatilis]|uniref:Uncharacterized protein n=1 Tax=Brachionus plicatilis TaxID=10195 RepID=A0A3M7RNK8_BRAPC|nr:hypothetical protein BpHYR1_036498 [Brachionus plicatilis]
MCLIESLLAVGPAPTINICLQKLKFTPSDLPHCNYCPLECASLCLKDPGLKMHTKIPHAFVICYILARLLGIKKKSKFNNKWQPTQV